MTIISKIRNMSAAVAFAEAGEFDSARSIAGMNSAPARSSLLETAERFFAAVAFAESGLFTEADNMAHPTAAPRQAKTAPNFLELIGLQHVPVHLVCVAAD